MSWVTERDTIMTAVVLMTVVPTDRALTGWMPFRYLPGQDEDISSDHMLHSLSMTGAGGG